MAVAVSVALHALFFFRFGGAVSVAPAQHQVSQPHITRIHLIAASKPNAAVVKPPEQPKPPAPKQVRRVARRTPAKPKVESFKPRPLTRPQRKVETAHVQHPGNNAANTTPTPMARAPAPSVPAKQVAIDDGMIARERLRYLAQVMAHIERHKYYPATARRRGIQGDVDVRFVLLADGSIRQVMVEGASSVLQKAAKKAVIKSVPMPKPPKSLPCPMHCEFTMRYALK